MSNVLVVFQADTENTEQLALAVAVGAVEAEGNIRLRRLTAAGSVEVGHKGYGKLSEADLAWAHTLVVGLESEIPQPEVLEGLLGLLKRVDADSIAGKAAWTFGPDGVGGTSEAQIAVGKALQAAGFAGLTVDAHFEGPPHGLIEAMKEAGRVSARNRS